MKTRIGEKALNAVFSIGFVVIPSLETPRKDFSRPWDYLAKKSKLIG